MAVQQIIRRLAIWTGLTLLTLAVLLAGLRLAAGQAPGRWLVAAQLDGREIPGVGRVSVSGLHGDPLSRLQIDRLTLTDDDGVWLTAENLVLDWTARSLLSRPIRINELLIEQVAVDRRPVLDDAPNTDNSPPSTPPSGLPALDLERFVLTRLELADGVAGPQADLAAEARARVRTGDTRLSLTVERLDAPGDRLDAELTTDGTGVSGTLTARGDADGTLAALLRMPGHAVRIDGEINGDARTGRGHVELSGDSEIWAEADIGWDSTDWQVSANVGLSQWELVPAALSAEVAAIDALAEGRRGDGVSIDSVSLQAGGSRLVLSDVTAPIVEAEFDISPALLDRLSDQRVGARSLTGTATIARGAELDVQVRPRVEDMQLAGATISAIDGLVDITLADGRPRLALDLGVERLRTGNEIADRLAGDLIRITGEIADEGGDVGWQAAPGFTIRSDSFTAIAEGHLAPDATWPVGRMSADLADMAAIRPELSGPVRAEFQIDADRNINVTVDGSSLVWPDTTQGLLDGLSGRARLTPNEQGWEIATLNASSPAVDLTMTGYFAGAEDWQASGDLALSGTLPVAAVEIDGGLATGFRLVRDREALRLRSVTTTRQLQAGPVQLRAPRLGVRGRLAGTGGASGDDAVSLEWVFTAERDSGDVAFDGNLRHANGTTDLLITHGQAGDLTLEGSARLADQALSVSLDAGRQDLMSLTADFNAPLGDLRAGHLEAELVLEAQRLGEADLNAASLTLTGPLSGMDMTAHADGRMRSNVDLRATGEVSIGEDSVAVSLSPSGKWAAHNWTTLEPIRFATGADGVAATASFGLGGGRLDLDLRTAGIDPIASLTIDSLPVGVLADITAMPATRGMISGTAELGQTDGVWRGSAQLAATGLVAGDLADMPELDLTAELSLQDDARARLSLSGGGLVGGGEITRAGPTTNIASPLGEPDAPLSGQISANGELMALAALFLPSDILVESGRLESQINISGTVSEPSLNGNASLRGGRVNATTTGSLVTDLELDLVLSETRIEVTRLSASDGREGRLSGQGHVVGGQDGLPSGSGRVEYERFVAVRRPELTLQASGDIDLTLDEDGLLVGGESRVDQLRTQPTLNGAASIPQLQVVEINLPKDRRASNSARIPVRIDYRVRANDGLYVSSRAFSSEWGVDLHITGPERKPSLYGTATLVGGTAFVFNRRFTLADGTVTFDGAPNDARVDLSAVHARSGFRATARVTGSARAPTITLTSDPSLPEDEILARLLFDQSVDELGAFEAAQLAAQLSGQSLLNVVGQLRDLAGIDRLDISTNEAGNLSVVGGRRFGDNVYVEVGSNGASAINQALIEWSLTPDLSILSRVSADTDAAVSIRWRRDY